MPYVVLVLLLDLVHVELGSSEFVRDVLSAHVPPYYFFQLLRELLIRLLVDRILSYERLTFLVTFLIASFRQ